MYHGRFSGGVHVKEDKWSHHRPCEAYRQDNFMLCYRTTTYLIVINNNNNNNKDLGEDYLWEITVNTIFTVISHK